MCTSPDLKSASPDQKREHGLVCSGRTQKLRLISTAAAQQPRVAFKVALDPPSHCNTRSFLSISSFLFLSTSSTQATYVCTPNPDLHNSTPPPTHCSTAPLLARRLRLEHLPAHRHQGLDPLQWTYSYSALNEWSHLYHQTARAQPASPLQQVSRQAQSQSNYCCTPST